VASQVEEGLVGDEEWEVTIGLRPSHVLFHYT